jgi:Putative Flp pilus-assembly TadE/G-like
MLPPLIHRHRSGTERSSTERGFTMALVAVALLSIIAMAALSIDIGTLYQAKAEAQRAADAAALTAARVISISGITGDPTNGSSSWGPICGGLSSAATLAANSVANQNLIGGSAPSTVNVYYGTSSGAGTNTDCTGAKSSFGVNPVVTVYVQQAKLPTFFARVFSLIPGGTSSNSGVSATASAEAFNPSGTGSSTGSNMIPVQPRCVKPWIIPNLDPGNLSNGFVSTTGNIVNQGIFIVNKGVIGESFNLNADCKPGASNCHGNNLTDKRPQWNSSGNFLEYVPALISGNPSAIPACSPATGYQATIAGCDQTTVYACGTPGGTQADLTENPVNPGVLTGDTSTAVSCLTQAAPTYKGADILATMTFPFQIQAGLGNALVQAGVVSTGDTITTSNSIVTIPVYDGTQLVRVKGQAHPDVTIVGFLQVFINGVDTTTGTTAGNINVTVLNVAGCSNNATNSPVFGTSPVPVRLITPP